MIAATAMIVSTAVVYLAPEFIYPAIGTNRDGCDYRHARLASPGATGERQHLRPGEAVETVRDV